MLLAIQWMAVSLLSTSSLAVDPADADFDKACRAFADVESYRFVLVTRSDGAGFGAQAGRRGPGSAKAGAGGNPGGDELTKTSDPTLGAFQKGKPVHFQRGETRVFRGEDGAAYHAGVGSWGFIGSDDQINEVLKAADAPRREVMAAMTMSQTLAPHEIFEPFAETFVISEKMSSDGGTIFKGTLSPEGAQNLAGGWSKMGRQARRNTGNGPQLAYTGDFEIRVDDDGAMTKIVIKTVTSGQRRGEPFKRIQETTIDVTGVGETEIDVPSEAQVKLGS